MKKITLEIKAEDIMTSSYIDCGDCAITRALHRAGYEKYQDEGTDIYGENGEVIISLENDTYDALVSKVISMYDYKQGWRDEAIKPADFTHELIY